MFGTNGNVGSNLGLIPDESYEVPRKVRIKNTMSFGNKNGRNYVPLGKRLV
jgi:hypothetical protein